MDIIDMLSGAGILFIENYKNTHVVTLFGKKGMTYSDVGGTTDEGESSEETAYREAREETGNLIHITPSQLRTHAKQVIVKSYLGFIMYITNLRNKDYESNMNQIFNKCNSPHWKETNSMVRIPLQHLISVVISGGISAYDVNGVLITIRGRTMSLIKNSINIIQNMIQFPPLELKRKIVKKSRMPCLIGTIQYTLKNDMIDNSNYIFNKVTQNINFNVTSAIYITPQLSVHPDPFFKKCNPRWGGIHITLVGFSNMHPSIQNFIPIVSNGLVPWTISTQTIKIQGKTIYFRSKTLDRIADFLSQSGFTNIKGPKYSGAEWHITSECDIPYNIVGVLENTSWNLTRVTSNNGFIQWYEQYPLLI